MTYPELTQLLQDYLENSETSFVDNIPLIVKQGEARVYNQVRTMDQRKTVTDVVSTGTITPPEDFIEMLYLMVDGVMLKQRQKSFLRTVYGDTTGDAESYSLDYTTLYSGASTINIAPIPSTEVDYEMSYAGAPYSITDQEETYLSVNFPECLLYACLLEGAIYNKSETDILTVYGSRFDSALAALKRSAEGLQLEDEYRNPPVRN
jgi:hypothetical protein